MSSLFCRHNRFTADCPICSRGTLLDSSAPRARPRPKAPAPGPARSRTRAATPPGAARAVSGPYAAAGPYERDGSPYEVRLERVPGGLRLAEWARGALERRAPTLAAHDLPALVEAARERGVLDERDRRRLERAIGEPAVATAAFGASGGRAGELRDELRVEPCGDGMVRIGRWRLRPNHGWDLQDAPPMLPVERYVEALEQAARAGLL